MHPEFPDEDIMALLEKKSEDKDRDKWIVWFDDASNALGHRVGAALVSPDNQCIPFTTRLGVIGDLLASSDTNTNASILVVQQQQMPKSL